MVLLHPLPTQRHDCHCTRTHTFTFQQMYTDATPSLVKTVPKCLVVIFISPPLLQPHLSLTKLPGPESHLCGLRKAESREAVDCSLPPWGICLASLLPVIQENVAPELSVICPVTYCPSFRIIIVKQQSLSFDWVCVKAQLQWHLSGQVLTIRLLEEAT